MTDSPGIVQIKELINQGNFIEGKKELDNLNHLENYTDSDKIKLLILRGLIFIKMGDYNKSLKIIDEIYQKNLTKFPLLNLETHLLEEEALWRLGKYDESLRVIDQAEKIFKDLEHSNTTILQNLQLKRHKGVILQQKGELEQALDLTQQVLVLAKSLNDKREISNCLNNLGTFYMAKHDIDLAMNYFEKCLSIVSEIGSKRDLGIISLNIGMIHFEMGSWSQTLKFLNQSLELNKEIGDKDGVANCLVNLGFSYLNRGEIDEAIKCGEEGINLTKSIGNKRNLAEAFQLLIMAYVNENSDNRVKELLQEFSKLNEQESDSLIDYKYRFSQARVLKMSNRITEKVKAQEIFQQLITEDITYPVDHFYMMLDLCELLIAELKTYGEPTVFIEIKSLQLKMMNLAKNLQSNDLMVKTLIFEAKLRLVDGDIKEAKTLLDLAKNTLTEQDSISLKNWVNWEIKNLGEQLNKWDNLIQKNLSLKERLDNARLADYVAQATRFIQEIS